MTEDWDAYVHSRFPGYLLPASAATSLSAEEARRFLLGITGQPDQLELLRASSMFAQRTAELRIFCDALVDLSRNLPSRTKRIVQQSEGGFQGKLATAQTRKLHDSGRTTTFAATSTYREFDLPENVLIRAVYERLKRVLSRVRAAMKKLDKGWVSGIGACEAILRRAELSKAMDRIAQAEVTAIHEHAARMARHHAYHHAARWVEWLRTALDGEDPSQIAEIVAGGALLPLEKFTRFELAVAIRLAEGLEREISQHERYRWRTQRALVIPNRREMIAFVRDDGVAIRLFYNQAIFPIGAAEQRRIHYLGDGVGRMRPDVTITVTKSDRCVAAMVVECKMSTDSSYILSGYHEATVYRTEYAEHLSAWPKAVLVVSGRIQGDVRAQDDVIACGWGDWPPPQVVEGILEQALR